MQIYSRMATLASVASDSEVPWTVAHQAPRSMGFSRQGYWSGLPFPSPEHLLNPGIELASPALARGFFTAEPPGKPFKGYIRKILKESQYTLTSCFMIPSPRADAVSFKCMTQILTGKGQTVNILGFVVIG